MKKSLIFILTITLFSCAVRRPIITETTENNQTYKVDYLFEHDGCKVYRFYDKGRYVYFTNCQGETIDTKDSLEIRNSTKIIRKQ